MTRYCMINNISSIVFALDYSVWQGVTWAQWDRSSTRVRNHIWSIRHGGAQMWKVVIPTGVATHTGIQNMLLEGPFASISLWAIRMGCNMMQLTVPGSVDLDQDVRAFDRSQIDHSMSEDRRHCGRAKRHRDDCRCAHELDSKSPDLYYMWLRREFGMISSHASHFLHRLQASNLKRHIYELRTNLVHGDGTFLSRVGPYRVAAPSANLPEGIVLGIVLGWAPIGFAAVATPRPSQYYFGHT